MNPDVNERALQLVKMRFISGDMDGRVKIWQENEEGSREFELKSTLETDGESDNWVRDVAWCNNIGQTNEMVAAVDENKTLRIWRSQGHQNNQSWVQTFSRV